MNNKSLFNIIQDSRYNDNTIIDFLSVSALKNKFDNFGNTILMTSIYSNREKLSLHLINNFSDYCYPESINKFGNTALICALISYENKKNNINIIKALINVFGLRCKPNNYSEDCDSIFFWSCKKNVEEVANLYLENFGKYIDWNYTDKDGKNINYYIIKNGLINILDKLNSKLLIENIIKTNIETFISAETFEGFLKIYCNLKFFNYNANIVNTIFCADLDLDNKKLFCKTVCEYIVANSDFKFFANIVHIIDKKGLKIFLHYSQIPDIIYKIIDLFVPVVHNYEDLKHIVKIICFNKLHIDEIHKIVGLMFEKNINLSKKIFKHYLICPFYKFNNKLLVDYFFESNNKILLEKLFENIQNTDCCKIHNYNHDDYLEIVIEKTIKYKQLINDDNTIKKISFDKVKASIISKNKYELVSNIYNEFSDFLNNGDIQFIINTDDEDLISKFYKQVLVDKFNSELFITAYSKKLYKVIDVMLENAVLDQDFISNNLKLFLRNLHQGILLKIFNKLEINLQNQIFNTCLDYLNKEFNIKLYKILDNYPQNKNNLYSILEKNIDKHENKYCNICFSDNDKQYILFECNHVLNIDLQCIKKLKHCPICRKEIFNYLQVYVA